MPKYKYLYCFVVFLLAAASCKKDTLHFKKVQQLDSHSDDRFNAILFINNKRGFVVGGKRFDNATILMTDDGGNTWQLNDMKEAGKALYGICITPWGSLHAVGYDGKLLSSTDDGDHWYFTQLNNWQSYKDIAYIDEYHGMGIIGISFNSGGIAYMNDIGQISRYDSVAVEYNDIEMVTPKIGYIAGYGVMLKTIDSGKTWQQQNIINDNFKAITTLNEHELWACGNNGSIIHTINGGNDWKRLRNGNDITIPRYYLNDILFLDGMNGWAVGDNGVVIYTNDGGEHWIEYDRFTTDALRSIAEAPDHKLLVCGDNGALYKLTIDQQD